MKKFFISFMAMVLICIPVFAEQKVESVRVHDYSLTASGSGETVAKYIRSYLSKGYVQAISYDSSQECIIIMYDTSIHKSQSVKSIRFRDFSLTNKGSGEAVANAIKSNLGSKTISAFSYDYNQKCIIVVYED